MEPVDVLDDDDFSLASYPACLHNHMMMLETAMLRDN